MNQRGFTLLELLAAMAIFAVLSVMAYGGLNALILTNQGLRENYQRLQTWQQSVQRLREELAQMRERPIRDEFGDPQPAFFEPENNRIEFTRGGRVNPLGLPRSSLQRVAYFLDTNGEFVRLSWANLDRAQADKPMRAVLLSEIETVQWRFLSETDEWSEDWPPANALNSTVAQVPLPKAVELNLSSKALGELQFLFAARADL